MKTNLKITLLAGLLALLPILTTADTNLARELTHIAFSEAERQVMERYFGYPEAEQPKAKGGKSKGGPGKKQKGLPPGLAKKDQLPPGLAKRSVLPPGLNKHPLPNDLERRLPPLRDGLERVIVDGSVVLIEQATGTVLDILEHIAQGH